MSRVGGAHLRFVLFAWGPGRALVRCTRCRLQANVCPGTHFSKKLLIDALGGLEWKGVGLASRASGDRCFLWG